jgi:hypothetical protein
MLNSNNNNTFAEHFYNDFMIEQSIKLINNGFDGSNLNRASLRRARMILLWNYDDLMNYANCNQDSKVYNTLVNTANEVKKIADKVVKMGIVTNEVKY